MEVYLINLRLNEWIPACADLCQSVLTFVSQIAYAFTAKSTSTRWRIFRIVRHGMANTRHTDHDPQHLENPRNVRRGVAMLQTDMTIPPPLLFTEAEWDAAVSNVSREMTQFLSHRRVPVFEDHDDHGKGWGSGSFFQLGSKVFILTNEHISNVRFQGRTLMSQLRGQEDVWKIVGNHFEQAAPQDLALLPVPDEVWAKEHCSKAILADQVAAVHQPVTEELLAFTGFAGERVHFHFSTLLAEATCYTAREIELPSDSRFNDRFHFCIDYRPDLAKQTVGTAGLPLPPGLSGSTVWDTKFVAAKRASRPWSPKLARVTGVVWGWPSNHGCIVATRAEHLGEFLLQATKKLGTEI